MYFFKIDVVNIISKNYVSLTIDLKNDDQHNSIETKWDMINKCFFSNVVKRRTSIISYNSILKYSIKIIKILIITIIIIIDFLT